MKNILYWLMRIVAAIVMLQTLYFKFTGAEESVYIFSTLGMEPWGRIGVGVLELIASILLFINPTAWMGSILGLGLMLGAIGMHVTLLGIEIKGDGGYLFLLSWVVTLCSLYVLWMNKKRMEMIWYHLFQKERSGI